MKSKICNTLCVGYLKNQDVGRCSQYVKQLTTFLMNVTILSKTPHDIKRSTPGKMMQY